MVTTFTKITYDSLPDSVRNAVISYDDKQVVIDETKLTTTQLTRFTQFMNQQGYK